MAGLRIGEVAERAGVTVPTIRYYERIGLLRKAARSQSGYRRYPETIIEELSLVRKAQALGFSLEEIGSILTLGREGQQPCAHVLTLARNHLITLEERIRQMQRFRDVLAGAVEDWSRDQPCEGLCQMILNVEPLANDLAAPTSARPTRPRRVKT